MRRETDGQSARRVVEEPRRNVLPFFAAVVTAVGVWSFQQQPLWDQGETRQTREEKTVQLPERGQDSRGAQPARGDLRTLFSANDYPAEAQRNNEQGTVQVDLAIDTRGVVDSCTIVRSSGHASLDQATCSILQRRARFAPAHDANGVPVPDTVTSPPVVWRLEG